MLSTCIKLPFVMKIFVLSIFEWPFYTGFTIYYKKVQSISIVVILTVTQECKKYLFNVQ